MKFQPVKLFILTLLLALPARAQTRPPTNFNAVVPVYQVTHAGASGTQGTNLAGALNINPADISIIDGVIAYENLGGFMTFPTNGLTNLPIISNLVASTANQYPSIPIAPIALNFPALSNLTVLSDSAAETRAGGALNAANLAPTFGAQYINHIVFSVIYSNINPNGGYTVVSNSGPLDTVVEYGFIDPNGYPIVGPGEQVQFNFNGNGVATRLHYSACELTTAPAQVPLMSQTEASNAAAPLFPPGATVNVQAVYYCPPFAPDLFCSNCQPTAWHPTNIIPWYYCTASINKTNNIGVAPIVTTIPLMPKFIPATLDPLFVPAVNLGVQAAGSNVTGVATATGGTPPYTYLWGGSDPNVSSNGSLPAISYTPQVRVSVPTLFIVDEFGQVTISWPYPSDGFVLESTPSVEPPSWTMVTNPVQMNPPLNSVTLPPSGADRFFRLRLASATVPVNETVTVTVTDANGVTAYASQTVAAQAVPINNGSPDPAIDYGCESPYDPGLGSGDRASWLTGMATGPGGGSQRFCWTGASAWPGDFIEPVAPGTLGAGPWEVGDADYKNWGVNSACIVLYIGHGNPEAISFVIYGNDRAINNCGFVNPQSALFEPLDQIDAGVAMGIPPTCGGPLTYYNVPNYIASWRNSGPTVNDNLYWLCLLSCEVLQEYTTNGAVLTGAWDRWGPAFNCLHILTGFDSLAEAGTGFPARFAGNILSSSQTIVQAWLGAAHNKNTGTAAALGPIGPDLVWDYNDHYWGKGPVGVSIPARDIQGWWYIKWPWGAPGIFP